MSAALVNRSLTTVRTELEFLKDSDVITEALYDKLVSALPQKYKKDEKPWDVDVLGTSAPSVAPTKVTNSRQNSNKIPSFNIPDEPAPSYTVQANELSNPLSAMKIGPPAQPPQKEKMETPAPPPPVGYCEALYDYTAQEADDLNLKKGDKIAVVEHLSQDWWKGYHRDAGAAKAGVFPSNYVKVISVQEFDFAKKDSPSAPSPAHSNSYGPPAQFGAPQPQLQQQPSYGGGYAQFPPPNSGYLPPAQPYQPQYQVAPQQLAPVEQQQQQQHSSGGNAALKKYGGRFGEAALFGAGASVGANIVNSIF
ncbi:uncharacterized protein LODBEIA_P33440 [Lodderomyces beijingensis]|uniref:SH3 domain-containing protein n=1 Tax=Lodderomyces beijingensis TaxID=1775926 RepID=A0ABP0ZSD1_9ASCO